VERLGFKDRAEMIRPGGGWSAIIAPTGQILAGPNRDTETILYADIDMALIGMFKYVSDSAGHYARPDVLSLNVNFEPQRIMQSAALRGVLDTRTAQTSSEDEA
jgi:aliphatic nitrilase